MALFSGLLGNSVPYASEMLIISTVLSTILCKCVWFLLMLASPFCPDHQLSEYFFLIR